MTPNQQAVNSLLDFATFKLGLFSVLSSTNSTKHSSQFPCLFFHFKRSLAFALRVVLIVFFSCAKPFCSFSHPQFCVSCLSSLSSPLFSVDDYQFNLFPHSTSLLSLLYLRFHLCCYAFQTNNCICFCLPAPSSLHVPFCFIIFFSFMSSCVCSSGHISSFSSSNTVLLAIVDLLLTFLLFFGAIVNQKNLLVAKFSSSIDCSSIFRLRRRSRLSNFETRARTLVLYCFFTGSRQFN